MFSRSSKRHTRVVAKPATVTIVKPEEKKVSIVKPALDLSKVNIAIIKPDSGLKVMVEEEIEGED